jgi:hypothetical protein
MVMAMSALSTSLDSAFQVKVRPLRAVNYAGQSKQQGGSL